MRSEAEPVVPVLMYHSVSSDRETGVRPYYRVVTTPSQFHLHLEILKGRNYSTYASTDLEPLLTQTLSAGSKPVLITFDDGYADFYRYAYPALQERGFSASMYLPTAYIGDQRETFKGRECLTWKEVRELSDSGVEFGSHTVTHPKLYQLSDAQIFDELCRSKSTIEDKIGRRVDSFAYPYAIPQGDSRFLLRLKKILIDVGYKTCFCTTIGRATRHSDSLLIERLPVNEDDDEALFLAKLNGAYDWMKGAQKALKLLKRFTIRART